MVELVDTLDLKSNGHYGRAGSSPAPGTSKASRSLEAFLILSYNMFWVYAISSISRNYIYVGLTDNLERRIDQHNKGYNRTTKPYAPFVLIYTEECDTRLEARKREKYLKSGVGKEFLRALRNKE